MGFVVHKLTTILLLSWCCALGAAQPDYPTAPQPLVVVYAPVGSTLNEPAAFIANEIRKRGAALTLAGREWAHA